MRIVHFDQMFHPDFGDQINLLPKYQVKQGHEVYIVTGSADVPHPRFLGFADNTQLEEKDADFEKRTGVRVIRIGIEKFISGRAIFKKGYKHQVDRLEPDVLFCHFNDTPVAMHYAWISSSLKYPVVFDSHMLEMASRNKFSSCFRLFYRMFITPKIIKNKLKVIRTQDDDYVMKHLGIPHELAPFISFGSDTSLFYPDEKVKEAFRKKHNISKDDFVVVYTGKLTESKGGMLLARAFEKRFSNTKRIALIVVGNAEGAQKQNLEEIFARSENVIIRYPTQKYCELPKFYQAADLAVFPKQCSLSFYDAQACGLPVVAEDNNINTDRLSHHNGYVFKTDDLDHFRDKILDFIHLPRHQYQKMSRSAHNFVKDNYNYEDIARQYTEVLAREYKRFKESGFND